MSRIWQTKATLAKAVQQLTIQLQAIWFWPVKLLWFTTEAGTAEDIASENNPAGEDGIGCFSIPEVEGGVGKATEIPTNCGNILTSYRRQI